MRYGLLTDVHANPFALERLTRHPITRQQLRTDTWWFLGDAVGYGPAPETVIQWLLSDAVDYWHIGNHELAYCWWNVGEFNAHSPLLNDIASLTCILHRALMRSSPELHAEFVYKIQEQNGDHFTNLARACPKVHHLDNLTVVTSHGSIYGKNYNDWIERYYIRPSINMTPGADVLKNNLLSLRQYQQKAEPVIGFVGHSHIQFLASLDQYEAVNLHSFTFGEAIPLNELPSVLLVNVGSTGKPHDGNERTAAVVLDSDDHTITFYRESYNTQEIFNAFQSLKLQDILNDNDTYMLKFVFGDLQEEELLNHAQSRLMQLGVNMASGNEDAWVGENYGKVLKLTEEGVSRI